MRRVHYLLIVSALLVVAMTACTAVAIDPPTASTEARLQSTGTPSVASPTPSPRPTASTRPTQTRTPVVPTDTPTVVLTQSPTPAPTATRIRAWSHYSGVQFAFEKMAPPEVQDIWARITERTPVPESDIILFNTWSSSFMERIGYVPRDPVSVTLGPGTPSPNPPNQAVLSLCEEPPQDSQLTSPVKAASHLAPVNLSWPLGLVRRGLDIVGTGFGLAPETEIYAPIAGQLTMAAAVSWEKALYTVLDIRGADSEVSIVLPFYWEGPYVPYGYDSAIAGAGEKCLDCAEAVGIVNIEHTTTDPDGIPIVSGYWGREWVNRGDLVAIYHHGTLSVGGLEMGLVVARYPTDAEGNVDLLADAPLNDLLPWAEHWYGGQPTFCDP